MNVSIAHVDTCLPSFLTDHHNRDGECLFGVYVDGTTTVRKAMLQLVNEVVATGDRIPDHVGDSVIAIAIADAFKDADPNALFDNSLAVPERDEDGELVDDLDGGDMCQAWFVLTWETPND